MNREDLLVEVEKLSHLEHMLEDRSKLLDRIQRGAAWELSIRSRENNSRTVYAFDNEGLRKAVLPLLTENNEVELSKVRKAKISLEQELERRYRVVVNSVIVPTEKVEGDIPISEAEYSIYRLLSPIAKELWKRESIDYKWPIIKHVSQKRVTPEEMAYRFSSHAEKTEGEGDGI